MIDIVKSLGFKQAYTIEEGTNSPKANPYTLKRLVVFDEPIFMFKTRVSGILDDIKNLYS